MTKTCEICNEPFETNRPNAKRCRATECRRAANATHARASRLRRGAHTPERRRNQMAGLDKKYAAKEMYEFRGEAREALQRLGLIPKRYSGKEENDGAIYHPGAYDPILWHRERSTPPKRRVNSPLVVYKLPEAEPGDHFVTVWAGPAEDGLTRRRVAIPGDLDGRALPGDSGLRTSRELTRRHYLRFRDRAQSDLGRRLRPLEKLQVLAGARAPKSDLEHENDFFRDPVTFWRDELRDDRKGVELAAIATDDELAVDAERLAVIAQETLAIAVRLQARFPSARILQSTVDELIEAALAVTQPT